MLVGVPKEIKESEYRVGMVPVGVETLRRAGHSVLVEAGAGLSVLAVKAGRKPAARYDSRLVRQGESEGAGREGQIEAAQFFEPAVEEALASQIGYLWHSASSRGRTTYTRSVHEEVLVDGPIGHLREPIVHYSHPTISAFIQKLDRYTTVEATIAKGSTLTLALRAVLEPGPYFIYKYVVQKGFLDGWRGVAMALLMAFYRCVGYLKALELRHQGPPERPGG